MEQVYASDIQTRKIAFQGAMQVHQLTQGDFVYYHESHIYSFMMDAASTKQDEQRIHGQYLREVLKCKI